MKRRFSVGLVALAVVGALGWDRAYADALINNFGLVNPYSTLTFDEIPFPSGTVITNQYADFGISFTPSDPGVVYDVDGDLTGLGYVGISGHYVGNYFPVNNPFSIVFQTVFATAQNQAAFALATSPETNTTFTALLGGAIVESFTAATTFNDVTAGYYGFVNILFDEIRILVDTDLALVDNIQLGAPTDPITSVPEPSTLLLVLSGGAAVASFRRRRLRHTGIVVS